MRNKFLSSEEKWILAGIPALFVIGTFMHFLYDLSGKNIVFATISAVNESVWEHLKMVLLPVILWWSIYYLIKMKSQGINKNKWFTSALVSLFISLISIPMLYYFYTEAFGVELIVVDISILFISVLLGQFLGLHFYKYSKGINFLIPIGIFIALIIFFIFVTFYPPSIPIFRDSLSGSYGL